MVARGRLLRAAGRGGSGDASDDALSWARAKGELGEAAAAEVLPAFERMLLSLAGPGSTLRKWGALSEESATRLERIERQAAAQPTAQRALAREVAAADASLQKLAHQARLAAALQDNLESRARALRRLS